MTGDNPKKLRKGLLPRIRVALVGERDVVSEQLRGVAAQGKGFARMAHACAFLMIVLFSLSALVGITKQSVSAVLQAWQHGQFDFENGVAAGVSGALVLCMDVASLYAALTLRSLIARRAPWTEKLAHFVAIAVADALEAGTILYMTSRFDTPATAWVWLLVVGRDVAAPLFAVYLSLAQPRPVDARDVLRVVEVEAGIGMARDALAIASDPDSSIGHKATLYSASASIPPYEVERLARVVAVLEELGRVATGFPTAIASVEESARNQIGAELLARPPEGGRNLIGRREISQPYAAESRQGNEKRSNDRTHYGNLSSQALELKSRGVRRADVGLSQEDRVALKSVRRDVTRRAISVEPGIGVRGLARTIQADTGRSVSESTASHLLAEARAEQQQTERS